MPVAYLVSFAGKLVIERWVGSISHAELMAHEKKQLQDTSIAPGAAVLADARSASFTETSYDIIHELSDLHADPRGRTFMARLAIVIGEDDFNKAKAFESQLRRHGMDAIVFSSANMDLACHWLGIDPLDTQKLIMSIAV